MSDLNSSPTNEKPTLDGLFPELKKADTGLPAPRFMAPLTAAATLLKGAPPSARVVPPPPSMRKPPSAKPSSVKPPPPSARMAFSPPPAEIDPEEMLATSPEASPAPLEPIHPVDDDELVDDGPTIALPSSLVAAPITSLRAAIPAPPPSRRSAPPPSAAKLPPLPSAPLSAKASTPSASKLPPVPMPPPSLRSAPTAPELPAYLEEDEEPMLPSRPAASAKAAAAASLVASSSGPMRAYVPPAPPPASSPAPASSSQETPASRAHSLIPTVASLPPAALSAPPAKKSRAGVIAFGLAASVAVFGALGFAAVKGGAALGIGGARTGSIAITASGPNGAKVDGVRVRVDGAVKCESAPCRLSDVTAGAHFVSAEAPGYSTTAARAVSIEKGAEASLHIDLVPASPEPALAAAAPKPEQKAASLDDLKAEEKAAAPSERASHKASKADAKDVKGAKKADTSKDDAKKTIGDTGGGTLNINSIPVANVVLDGRPVGSTPLVGLKVSAGPHSVVFIHPEKGRKASGTTVKAGATATVAVRF